MSRKLLWMLPIAAVLGVAWYLFRPELLWLNSTVAETLDDAIALGDSTAVAAMPIALLHGRIRGVHHDGAGAATVLRLADGTRVLRLTEFATDNGPDLYVYLVASTDAADNDTVERAGYVSLGRLKGNEGDQNYVVPSELDLSLYRAVSIWCKRFGVNFAAAALSDVMPDTNHVEPHDTSAEIITVRPPAEVMTKQGLPNFVGISEATAGTKHISMNLVVIPPGEAAEPHFHSGFESAIYLLQGRVETRYGEGLAKSVINEEGDFLFIPPNVPHQPRNLSTTERALAIVARNTATEQESVQPYATEER